MEYFHEGSPDSIIDKNRAGVLLDQMLGQLGTLKRVLLLPPDFTRFHSWAGELTVLLYERLKETAHVEIMPTLGTHVPMTDHEIGTMFPGIPAGLFRTHDWRKSLVKLGEVPGEFMSKISGGLLNYSVTCELNELMIKGQWDRIISIGQLVPHEVIGIANQNKNIFVGAGGQDTINKSHFLGAVVGMESIMGREKSPVRDVFNYMKTNFCPDLPVSYLLTVRAKNGATGELETRGMFAGDDNECYLRGASLCQKVNLDLLDKPLKKVVVYLNPSEFKSTWLGNKAIYRTRMAMADDGELIIMGPAVKEFGEDEEIDRLIRKYGYRGTPYTLKMVSEHEELGKNLSAAAHLIHGSSEGRFNITYCPGKLSGVEVEGAGFRSGEVGPMMALYNPEVMTDGLNKMDNGEEVFYISNPALGLWGLKSQFQ